MISFIFLSGILFTVDRGTYFKQSILERKKQYLSIPIENIAELITGNGIGSYVYKLKEKSPGLFLWQYQPIHNSYVLVVYEVGLLPLAVSALYFWQNRKRSCFRKKNYSSLQIFIFAVSLGVALLFAVDHYMWDLEQGQLLLIILLTTLVFSFRLNIQKTIK